MPIIDFSQAGKILAGSRKSDRPVGGMRLRYEPDFGYVLRYEPRNYLGSDLVKILPGGVYKVSDGGHAGPTTIKKLSEFSPLAYFKPYQRAGRIYFGLPVGRFGMGSKDWITLTPKDSRGYVVAGACEPDPKETPRWTQALVEAYADTLVNWVIEEGRLPLGHTKVTASEVAEFVLSSEPNREILSAAVSRAGSKKAIIKRVVSIEKAILDERDRRMDPDHIAKSAADVLPELHASVVNALRSIRKDIKPIITEWIVANGMP